MMLLIRTKDDKTLKRYFDNVGGEKFWFEKKKMSDSQRVSLHTARMALSKGAINNDAINMYLRRQDA